VQISARRALWGEVKETKKGGKKKKVGTGVVILKVEGKKDGEEKARAKKSNERR